MLVARAVPWLVALILSPLAQAAIYPVSTLADTGPGSLRQAVADANANAGIDDITFTIAGTIGLTSGQLVVTESVNILGPGARSLTVDGNLNGRILEIQNNTTNVRLSGLTLTRGLTAGNGGAILNAGGILIMQYVRITDSQAGGEGGAIYDGFQPDVGGSSVNHLVLSNSEISGNRANKNAAIYYSGFELRIDNSTIHGNVATDSVGGILVQFGFATIHNSTISGNSANFVGGFQSQDSTVTFESTILANNSDSTGANDINRIGSGTVNATTSLFEEDVNATSVINGTNSGNLVGVDPQLEPFGNNGGPTDSLRPGVSSPVLGVGSNPGAYAFDQRGPGFPRDAGGAVDIGAIQRALPPHIPGLPVPALDALPLALLSLLLALAGLALRRRH